MLTQSYANTNSIWLSAHVCDLYANMKKMLALSLSVVFDPTLSLRVSSSVTSLLFIVAEAYQHVSMKNVLKSNHENTQNEPMSYRNIFRKRKI